MKARLSLAGILMLVLFMSACTSCARRTAWTEGQRVSGNGTFTLIGSEPLARPAIRLDDGRILLLDASFRRSGAVLVGRRVRYSGTVTMRELISADAKNRVREYILVPESTGDITTE